MADIQKFRAGSHVNLGCEVRRSDTNALETPSTSHVVTLVDNEGTTQVNGLAMTADSTGKLSYNYAIPAAGPYGVWDGYWTLNAGGIVSMLDFQIEVVAKVYA